MSTKQIYQNIISDAIYSHSSAVCMVFLPDFRPWGLAMSSPLPKGKKCYQNLCAKLEFYTSFQFENSCKNHTNGTAQSYTNYFKLYTPSNRRHLAPGVHVEISSPVSVKHLAKPLPHGSDRQTNRSIDNKNTHTEKLGFVEACAILQEVTFQTFWNNVL